MGVNNPVDVVAGGSSVVSLVDVALPGSARKPPPELTSTVRYAVATGPLSNLVDRTRVTLRTPVAGAPPVVIAPPLRGSGWWGFNACCDPNGSHRSGVAALDGVFKIVEAYAIDYMKVVRGSVVRGDGAEVTDFFNYGSPVHSVAGGRVVAVHRGVPNALWPPPDSGPPNPEVKTSADYTGESVIAKIAPHRFALYAHLAPGSIRVEEGQRLNTGQVIGELGNSGNSYAPHLHFAVQSKPSPFAASRPYVFDRFKLEGYGIPDPATPARATSSSPPTRGGSIGSIRSPARSPHTATADGAARRSGWRLGIGERRDLTATVGLSLFSATVERYRRSSACFFLPHREVRASLPASSSRYRGDWI